VATFGQEQTFGALGKSIDTDPFVLQ